MGSTKVIEIRAASSISERRQIADLAYEYWLARGFRSGSPEQDLLSAMLEVTFRDRRQRTSNGLFLVRKAGS